MKKILILGASGMLGHVATEYLSSLGKYTVVPCARSLPVDKGYSVDVTDFDGVRKVLLIERPDIVLNAVGMLIKDCAARPDKAILVNAYFPHLLARIGAEQGYTLIQISTDCVFSGRSGGYVETSIRDGDSVYDRTKALGEIVNDRDLTIRTSIIGPELKRNGSGLFHWFMNQTGVVNGFTRAYWSGVTTLELSKAIAASIDQGICGLYQLAMPKISKYDLLVLMQRIWNRNVTVVPSGSFECDKSLLSTRKDFNYKLPTSYADMLKELRDWMATKSCYSY